MKRNVVPIVFYIDASCFYMKSNRRSPVTECKPFQVFTICPIAMNSSEVKSSAADLFASKLSGARLRASSVR